MSKINISTQTNGARASATPAVLSRPRSLVRHLARHLARRPNFRYVARLTKQVLLSASFTAGGILALQAAGFNLITPIGGFGAFLAIMGVGLVFGEEDTQTPEEYRQFVISHFEGRGETSPRWTQQVEVGQVWRHRITKRHYKVMSIRNGVTRCLLIDVDALPILAEGKAQFGKRRTFTLRYAFKLVGGAR